MWLTTIAVLVLIIYLVREQRGRGNTTNAQRRDQSSPMDVLDRTYASGELTTDEYQERKRKLLEDQL
jgi:putative membrane protein